MPYSNKILKINKTIANDTHKCSFCGNIEYCVRMSITNPDDTLSYIYLCLECLDYFVDSIEIFSMSNNFLNDYNYDDNNN